MEEKGCKEECLRRKIKNRLKINHGEKKLSYKNGHALKLSEDLDWYDTHYLKFIS